ncbi:MAG: ATP-dependent Clp protease adaptor ClpS [Proteobacteria bacterium]|nr:MAG: ATP-dependent Clp protease adaptor ClpS [Pseudomonadota bacterium]
MSDTQTIQPPVVKPEFKVKQPAMYVVLVHNDPYTPREFVVEVLQMFFQKNTDEAGHIMLKAHRTGLGAVGVYPLEIAETKTAKANKYSLDQGKLLLFSVEEA